MQIECPRCHARAQLPGKQEGAKVRCGECGRVYVAHPPGRGVRQKGLGPAAIVWLGVGFAGLVVFMLATTFGDDDAAQAQAPATPEAAAPAASEEDAEALDGVGWDSPVVQAAVRIHEAAFAHDTNALRYLLHGPRIWAREQATAATEDAAQAASAPEPFLGLPPVERYQHIDRWIEGFLSEGGRALVGNWQPYSAEVVELADGAATVHLAVTPRDRAEGVEKRWVEWRLALDGQRWKAWSWKRWFSPEELEAQRRARPRPVQKVTLTDGSLVLEAEPKPLEHLEETPPELRSRIDQLYATMVDLDLTKEAADAQHELVDIGKPALPILLTGLFETPLDSEENAIKCNLVVQTLRRITGRSFSYRPQLLEGSSVGTTEERRRSGIRQWFAWWHRNKDKFEKKEVEDGLEGLIELTEEEKRWLERNQD